MLYNPVIIYGEPETISADQFRKCRTFDARPSAWGHGRGKALLGLTRQRWHIVERQHQFGRPVYFAQPIIIRLTSVEVAGIAPR